MASSKFIGRVGGLAVALGVGVAIAGMTGTASADTSSSDSGKPSTSQTTKSSSTDSGSDDSTSSSSNDDADSASDSKDSEAEDSDDHAEADDDADEPRSRSTKSNRSAPSTDVSDDSDDADDATTGDAQDDESTPATVSMSESENDSSDAAPETPQAPSPWAALLTSLFNRPEHEAAQAADTRSFWARLEYALDNKAAAFDPEQLGQDAEAGVIHGTFNVLDSNSDLMLYEIISGPQVGSVVIDPNTGRYTYTPGADVLATGGIDSFTLRINDLGFHLFDSVENETVFVPVIIAQATGIVPPAVGESVVLRHDDPRAARLILAEEINEALAANPLLGPLIATLQKMRTNMEHWMIDEATAPSPVQVHASPTSGVVYGTLNPADANNDRLRYTITNAPVHGIVEIDAKTGAYIYTPNAGYFGDDSFTVSIDNATPRLFDSAGPVIQTVSVSMSQPPLDVDGDEDGPEAEVDGALTAAAAGVHFPIKFFNYTQNALKITTVGSYAGGRSLQFRDDEAFQDSPSVGQVLNPGDMIELKPIYYPLAWWTKSRIIFEDAAGNKTELRMAPYNGSLYTTFTCESASVCSYKKVYGGGDAIARGDGEVILYDPVGTEVRTADPVKQASLLDGYCGAAPDNCKFKITDLDKTAFTPEWQQYAPWDNPTSVGKKTEALEFSREVSTQHSIKLGVKATIEVLKAVKAELSTEYSYQVGDKTTFKKTFPSQDIAPYSKLTIWAKSPLLVAKGVMTLKWGNTTYTFTDVVNTLPDKKQETDPLGQTTITGRNGLYMRAEEFLYPKP